MQANVCYLTDVHNASKCVLSHRCAQCKQNACIVHICSRSVIYCLLCLLGISSKNKVMLPSKSFIFSTHTNSLPGLNKTSLSLALSEISPSAISIPLLVRYTVFMSLLKLPTTEASLVVEVNLVVAITEPTEIES